jgi:hypothetical protein
MKASFRKFCWRVVMALALMISTTIIRAEEPVIHLLHGNDLSGFYPFLDGFGKDHDPEKVFTMTNGILRDSGQEMGYLATKEAYGNYRLVVEFKWGEQTWGKRKTNARDSGVLINGQDKDVVWPKCIECQMIEGGTGDIIVVNGAHLTVDGVTKGPRIERFDRPGRNPWKDELGFRGPQEIEKPHGEWNTLEIIDHAGTVSISVNGIHTLTGTNCLPPSGRIMLQAEGAEVFFRRLDLYPLSNAAINKSN